MLTALAVADPLTDQEVTFIITLPADKRPRDERPVMVSVGVTEQAPVSQTGKFGALPSLLHEVWNRFGVQLQAVESTTGKSASVAEQVIATAAAQDETPGTQPSATRLIPKPQAGNLSLF